MAQGDESIQAIRDWMVNGVTKQVWAYLKEMAEDGDKNTHMALAKGDFQEAARWNAYTDAVNELINLPVEMIEEKKKDAA